MSKILSFSNETIRSQILKGKQWLRLHAQSPEDIKLDLTGSNYDDEQWQFRLKLYEKLVDEHRLRNLPDAIIMEDEEILENEKKRGEYLLFMIQTKRNTKEHELAFKSWFHVRNEGMKRGFFPFVVPSKNDRQEGESQEQYIERTAVVLSHFRKMADEKNKAVAS